MEREKLSIKVEMSILGIGSKIKNKEKEFSKPELVAYTEESGKMTSDKVK